jgi:signal peptidase I
MFKRYQEWKKHHTLSMLIELIEAIVVIVPIVFLIRTYVFGLYQVPSGSMETTMLVGERFIATKLVDLWLRPIKHGDIIAFNQLDGFTYSKNPVMNWWQRYVWGPDNWTKRVIGLPGDHIEGRIENGHPVVYRNGVKLDEPYANKYPLIPTRVRNELQFGIEFKSYDSIMDPTDQRQPFYRIMRRNIIDEQPGFPMLKIHEPGTPVDAYKDGSKISDIYDWYLKDDEYWVMGDNRLGSWDSRGWGPLPGYLIHGRIVFRFFSHDTNKEASPFLWIKKLQGWFLFDLFWHPIDFFQRVRWSRCGTIMH